MEVKERKAFPALGELPSEQFQEVCFPRSRLADDHGVFAAVAVGKDD